MLLDSFESVEELLFKMNLPKGVGKWGSSRPFCGLNPSPHR
jgi:hypothetical protein